MTSQPMNQPPAAHEVQRVIADVLQLELEEVALDKSFFHDLGGESLELIELTFHCERKFGARVRFEELSRLGDLAEDAEGRLTPESLGELRQRFPSLAVDRIAADPRRSRLRETITIGTLVAVVQEACERQQAAAGAQQM